MKNYLSLLILIQLFSIACYAQNICCSSATTEFAALGNESQFVFQHDAPLPYTLESDKGQMIVFNTTDGKTANAYAIQTTVPSNKYLIVFHEWWGLNDYIKSFSEKFFDDLKDVNIIAVDLYNGNVATTQEEAKKYMQELTTERAKAIMDGLLNKLGNNAEIATVGWCMGGGYSLQMAIESQQHAKGAIMYYGMPESNLDRLKTLQCPVLFFQASQDKWINDEVVNTFKKNMAQENKKLTVEVYDADHAFANPSNPKYNKEAAEDAYKKSIAFLEKAF